jgi:energy-coupling factor transporter transmembrane protein EcfT
MHAGLLMLVWVAGVAALQFLDPGLLLAAVAASLLAAVLLARRRCWRLLRRVRFLLLAIVILFVGFTPGEAVLPAWPHLSPSREGLLLALEHAGRLVAVVACVAILLERLPADRLVSGLYALCRPLRWLRLPPERLAVRLLLVLRYAESPPAGGWREWLGEAGPAEVGRLHLVRERLGAVDVLLLAVLAAAAAGWVAW